MTPDFETFSASVLKPTEAMIEPEDAETVSRIFRSKGADFDFYDDGSLDSLDMLDVAFAVEKDLGIKLSLEELLDSRKPMTLGNLYGSIRQTSKV
jgi:acyl carrier protein